MNQRDLNRLLARWQKRLRLQDWLIRIEIVDRERMSESYRISEIIFSRNNKIAKIYILDPSQKAAADYYDLITKIHITNAKLIEFGLLHELIHVHLREWDAEKDTEKRGLEQACNMIAWALLQ